MSVVSGTRHRNGHPWLRCAIEDPAGYVAAADDPVIGRIADLVQAPAGDLSGPHPLAPCDLQPVKACDVTFARSMIKRVVEEGAGSSMKASRKARQCSVDRLALRSISRNS